MKLHFYGAAGFVSGSCYLLDTGKRKILIDCGMFQGPKYLKERNYNQFPFEVADLDAVLLTHAHIDHSGLLPKLHKAGYRKPIYATEATVDLCSIMLPDSGHIQEMEVERKNRKAKRTGKKQLQPIYTMFDAVNTMVLFKKCSYHQPTEIFEEVSVTFKDAGHIMGSAIIEIVIKEENKKHKFVFSGDLGRKDQNIINDPDAIQEADYLIIETTYGNRLHGETENRRQKLADIITQTFKRGGNVIIPAFAVERTQDLLYDLNSMITEGIISPGTIYIDSPLAITATEIFSSHPETFDAETKKFIEKNGFLPFLPNNVKYSRRAEESQRLNEIKSGAIIISANGMAEAGRIRHHLRHNLWRPESSVVFVGYQAEGTLGRRLIDGEEKVRIFGEEIVVNADIHYIDAYSAHADYKDMLEWLSNLTKPPKKVFLVHGESSAAENFAKLISENLGWYTKIPGLFDFYDFNAEELVKSKESLALDLSKEKYYQDYFVQVYNSLDQIRNLLHKALNKKFNREQFKTVEWEISKITKNLGRIKKEK